MPNAPIATMGTPLGGERSGRNGEGHGRDGERRQRYVGGAPGLFQSVNFIQRLNTVGGNAPSTPGSLGQVANIPYTADYLFYKTP